MCLFISSVLFASGGFIQCCVCVKNWQWQLGAAAIFLAWFDLVLFMKKLPLFGVYVVMFIKIVYTFLRFMFLALLFIVAFGLAFYMLFVQVDEPVSCVCVLRGRASYPQEDCPGLMEKSHGTQDSTTIPTPLSETRAVGHLLPQ